MQNYSKNTNIEKARLLKILLIFLVILLSGVIAVYCYMINNKKEDYHSELYKYLKNNDLAFFIENEEIEKIIKKLEKTNFKISSNITLSNTMENNMFSKMDLSKFKFNSNFICIHNKSKYLKTSIKYSDNDFLDIDFILDNDNYAIKSDEIVNKYVGIKQNNLQNIIDKIQTKNIDTSTIENLKKFLSDREMIELSNLQENSIIKDYALIFKKEIDKNEIDLKENVAIVQNSNNVNVKEYTVELDSTQVKNILNDISDKIENDDELLDMFLVDDSNADKTIYDIQANTTKFETLIYVDTDNEETNTINNNSNRNEIENSIDNSNVNEISNSINNEETNEIQNNASNTINQVNNSNTENLNNVNTNNTTNESLNNNIVSENIIEESDNYRLQGFISINEDSEIDYSDIDENFIIGENYEETISNVEEVLGDINWKDYILTGSKANISSNEFVKIIKKYINEKINSKCSMILKIYVSDEKTIRIDMNIPETTETISAETVYNSDNEKYLNFTYVKGNDIANGKSISIYKKNTNAKKTYIFNINTIVNNKIGQKLKVNFEVTGSSNDKNNGVIAEITVSNSKGTLKINTDNTIDFNNVENIDELNDESCLFLDQLSNEDLISVTTEIKEKILNILKEKNRNLNIINLNTSSNVVGQTTINADVGNNQSVTRDKAKQVLIETLSNKMRKYMDDGKQLTLNDLKDLKVDGYEVSISITSDLAVIVVDGYKFNLDKDFNLSDSE